jgi:hypothetical protein
MKIYFRHVTRLPAEGTGTVTLLLIKGKAHAVVG